VETVWTASLYIGPIVQRNRRRTGATNFEGQHEPLLQVLAPAWERVYMQEVWAVQTEDNRHMAAPDKEGTLAAPGFVDGWTSTRFLPVSRQGDVEGSFQLSLQVEATL